METETIDMQPASPEGLEPIIVPEEMEPSSETVFDAPKPDAAPKSGVMSQDEFFVLITGAFAGAAFAAGMSQKPPQPPFRSLLEAPKVEGAREASDALYRTCERVPFLHFLIEPQSQWMQDAIVIGLFAVRVVGAVRAEIAERNDPRAQAKRAYDEGLAHAA